MENEINYNSLNEIISAYEKRITYLENINNILNEYIHDMRKNYGNLINENKVILFENINEQTILFNKSIETDDKGIKDIIHIYQDMLNKQFELNNINTKKYYSLTKIMNDFIEKYQDLTETLLYKMKNIKNN